MATVSSSPGGYMMRGRFGDTTTTKVFVGGLAWETPTEELQRYFEQFGDILEAVIITDRNTGRSKGYGFVTFRDPESARRSVAEPNPVIDGRRANCNIAALGRPRPSPPRVRHPTGSIYPSPTQVIGQPYSRVPAQVPPPPPVLYPTPYGYMTYGTDYRYQQQGMYNPQMPPQYYHEMYGPSSTSNVGPPPYYPHVGYTMQTPRATYPSNSQACHQQYMQYPTVQMEGSFTPSSSHSFGFQLQAPPHPRQPHSITGSQSPRQPSTNMENSDSSNA